MGLSSFFKNLFGSAKESTSELINKAETVIEKASPISEKVETFTEETFDKAKETVSEYSEKAGDVLGKVLETVKRKAAVAVDKVEDLSSEIKTTTPDTKKNISKK